MNLKLLILRIVIISFITTLIVSSYKIEHEADFFIFFGGILMGIAFLFVELANFEESKSKKL